MDEYYLQIASFDACSPQALPLAVLRTDGPSTRRRHFAPPLAPKDVAI
jgi:hypothetical protein